MDRQFAGTNRIRNDRPTDWVRGLLGWCKKKFQPHADYAGAYGSDGLRDQFGGTIPYECYVGLWLNTSRTSVRNARGILIALNGVLSKGEMSKEWFESFTEDAATADATYSASRARRKSSGPPHGGSF